MGFCLSSGYGWLIASTMRRFAHCVICILLWASTSVLASSLSYTVEGVRGTLKGNVEAWLGEEPPTPQARAVFLARLDERLASGLQSLGYYRPDIETSIDKTGDEWQLSIVIAPNDPVLVSRVDVRLLGGANEAPKFKKLLENNPLLPGNKLNHGDYEDFKRSILSMGQRLGYFDGEYAAHRIEVDPKNNTAVIELVYNSGSRYRFGELHFDQEQFERKLVDSLRTFQSGEYFDLALLQEFQAQLQRTRFFSGVVVRPQLQEAVDHNVPVSLKMYPAKSHSFDVGVGFSDDTRERVSLTWRSPKLNRFGHSQESRIEYSPINPSGRISYNIPLSHPLNDVLQLSVRWEDNEFGDIDSNQKELAVRREIKSAEGWIRSYFLRSLDESWELDRIFNNNAYVLPGITLAHKRRRGLLVDPSGGFSQLYRAEGGSEELGSDIDLLRLYSNFTYIVTPVTRHRIVGRAELGAVFIEAKDRKDLAPSLGFFAGGSQSIRGYSYQSLGNEVEVEDSDGQVISRTIGGDRLFIASLEYQYYVNDTWRGALFVDAGDAFDEGEFDVNVGVGFGVHYLTPVGAIKIEVANSVSDDNPSWRLHINIGAEF